MTEDKEEFEIVMDMIPILYGRTPVESSLIIDNIHNLYWKVEINKQLGKTPLLNLLLYHYQTLQNFQLLFYSLSKN